MVVASVLERMAEVPGLGLGVSQLVDLRMLGALVQLVLVFLDLVLGPAWVLPLGVIVLGRGILQVIGVLEFRCLLVLEGFLVLAYFLVLVLVFLLRSWIDILKSLRPCLGLESLDVEMVLSLGEHVSPGVCSRPFNELEGVPVLQGQGRQMVISPLPEIKGCT